MRVNACARACVCARCESGKTATTLDLARSDVPDGLRGPIQSCHAAVTFYLHGSRKSYQKWGIKPHDKLGHSSIGGERDIFSTIFRLFFDYFSTSLSIDPVFLVARATQRMQRRSQETADFGRVLVSVLHRFRKSGGQTTVNVELVAGSNLRQHEIVDNLILVNVEFDVSAEEVRREEPRNNNLINFELTFSRRGGSGTLTRGQMWSKLDGSCH